MAMAWWTWLTWCDPIVDFGRELYLPWQISEGQVLYRDLYSTFGPLSPYFNALLFKLFGVSLHTLVYANLLILALSIALFYRLLRIMADRFAATAGCLTFVMLFAFCQYLSTGNYNWICPYSHELTHGTVLSLAAMWTFSRFASKGQTRWLSITGVITGLVFLTKTEIFVALAGALSLGLVCLLYVSKATKQQVLQQIGLAVATTLGAPAVSVALLSTTLPLGTALRGTAGMWMYMFDSQVTVGHHFYQIGSGIDDVGGNLWQLLCMSLAGVLLLTPGYFAAVYAPKKQVWQAAAGAVVGALVFLAMWQLDRAQLIDWEKIALPLPLFIFIMTALATRRAFRSGDRQMLTTMLVCWFAMLLLLKMILNTRIHGYGFIHAMPATVLLVVATTYWVPQQIDRRGGRGMVFTAGALALWMAIGWSYLGISHNQIAKKTDWMASGSDAFKCDGRAEGFNIAVSKIVKATSNSATLAAFPEGVMLNYLARRRASVPYLLYIPHQVDIVGESVMLGELKANPPDVIVLISRNLTEYGVTTFGIDYAKDILAWIGQDYGRPVLQIDNNPLKKRAFGVWIFQHRGQQPK
jgi:4-amino-4-deoxy-L-arabinose transferase-like glycosyltransferase